MLTDVDRNFLHSTGESKATIVKKISFKAKMEQGRTCLFQKFKSQSCRLNFKHTNRLEDTKLEHFKVSFKHTERDKDM